MSSAAFEEGLATAAAHVLEVTGHPGGFAPGQFFTSLIEAWLVADPENHALLAAGYPAYGWAVYTYKHVPGGLDLLRQAVEAQWPSSVRPAGGGS